MEDKMLGELLLELGSLSAEDLSIALTEQKALTSENYKIIGKILLEKKLISLDDLNKAVSIQKSLDWQDNIGDLVVDFENQRDLINKLTATTYNIFPLFYNPSNNKLVLAIATTDDREICLISNDLMFLFNRDFDLDLVITKQKNIQELIDIYYNEKEDVDFFHSLWSEALQKRARKISLSLSKKEMGKDLIDIAFLNSFDCWNSRTEVFSGGSFKKIISYLSSKYEKDFNDEVVETINISKNDINIDGIKSIMVVIFAGGNIRHLDMYIDYDKIHLSLNDEVEYLLYNLNDLRSLNFNNINYKDCDFLDIIIELNKKIDLFITKQTEKE